MARLCGESGACMIQAAMDPGTAKRDRPDLLWAAVVGAIGFMLGVKTLGFSFVYDDYWTILDNGYLQSPGALVGLVDGTAAALSVPDAGRPLLVAHHWIEWRVFGNLSHGYHLFSLLWHVAACVLAYLVVLELTGSGRMAVAAGVLFAAHPIHAEVVAVVSFREDSMSCALALASWYVLLRSRHKQRGRRAFYAISAGFLFFLGMASKESVPILLVAFPLAGSLCQGSSLRREIISGRWEYLALAAAVAAGIGVRWALFGAVDPYQGPSNPHPGDLWGAEGHVRILTAARLVMVGFGQLGASGWGQALEYCEGPGTWTDPWSWFGVVGTVGLVVCAWAVRKRWPVSACGLAFMCIAFIPTSNLVWMPNIRADRFWYLSSFGFCLVAAELALAAGRAAARKIPRGWPRIGTRWLVVGILAVTWGVSLQHRLRPFKKDRHLWIVAAGQASCHARALTGAAVSHLYKNRPAVAERLVRRAIALRPGYAPAHQVLGRVMLAAGRPSKALEAFRFSRYYQFWKPEECNVGMARAFLELGRRKDAKKALARALHVQPDRHEAYFLRAELAILEGKNTAAARQLLLAIVAGMWKMQGDSLAQ